MFPCNTLEWKWTVLVIALTDVSSSRTVLCSRENQCSYVSGNICRYIRIAGWSESRARVGGRLSDCVERRTAANSWSEPMGRERSTDLAGSCETTKQAYSLSLSHFFSSLFFLFLSLSLCCRRRSLVALVLRPQPPAAATRSRGVSRPKWQSVPEAGPATPGTSGYARVTWWRARVGWDRWPIVEPTTWRLSDLHRLRFDCNPTNRTVLGWLSAQLE